MVYNQSEVPVNDQDVMIPSAAYAVRILEVEPKQSQKKGNRMIVVSGEIVSYNGQPTITLPGSNIEINVAGLRVRSNWMLTKEGIGQVFNAYRVLGHPVESLDDENPDCQWMKGAVILAIVDCQKQTKVDAFGSVILLPDGTKVETIQRGFWPNNVLGLLVPGNSCETF